MIPLIGSNENHKSILQVLAYIAKVLMYEKNDLLPDFLVLNITMTMRKKRISDSH